MRQIVLDTETTGLKVSERHRIIELGCYELVERRASGRTLHHYIHPQREIDEGAARVHGITLDALASKPPFADVAREFLDFVSGAELVIHNAEFDLGFINYELSLLRASKPFFDAPERIEDICGVIDTLQIARSLHAAGNSLDALCKRYEIDNSARTLHGAMLDAEILAEVYLAMTGGQTALTFTAEADAPAAGATAGGTGHSARPAGAVRVIRATPEELEAHAARLEAVDRASGGRCIWLRDADAG